MFRNSAMICFKCGQQGHRADQCQSPERLCYNCREAGHESKDCEKPHDAETKKCYNCGNIGHLAAECPNQPSQAQNAGQSQGVGTESTTAIPGGSSAPVVANSQGPKTCYICGVVGHIARNCPQSSNNAGRPSFSNRVGFSGRGGRGGRGGYGSSRGGATGIVCYKCGGPNHLAKDCLAPAVADQQRCYTCGGVGHIAKNCPSSSIKSPSGQQDMSNIKCYNCGEMGHFASDCTNDAVAKTCFKCGLPGHLIKDCPMNKDEAGVSTDSTSTNIQPSTT